MPLTPTEPVTVKYAVRIQGETTPFTEFEPAVRFWDSHAEHRDGDVLEYVRTDAEGIIWAAGNLIHVGFGHVYVHPRLIWE
jgi:hypothetical protein